MPIKYLFTYFILFHCSLFLFIFIYFIVFFEFSTRFKKEIQNHNKVEKRTGKGKTNPPSFSSISSLSTSSSSSSSSSLTWNSVMIGGGGYVIGLIAHPAQQGLVPFISLYYYFFHPFSFFRILFVTLFFDFIILSFYYFLIYFPTLSFTLFFFLVIINFFSFSFLL